MEIVVAKRSITNFQFFQAISKKLVKLPFDGGKYGIRLVLKNSFKAKGSAKVCNQYEMQLVQAGIDDYIKSDDAAGIVKVQKVIDEKKEQVYKNKIARLEAEVSKLKAKKAAKQVIFKVDTDKEEMF